MYRLFVIAAVFLLSTPILMVFGFNICGTHTHTLISLIFLTPATLACPYLQPLLLGLGEGSSPHTLSRLAESPSSSQLNSMVHHMNNSQQDYSSNPRAALNSLFLHQYCKEMPEKTHTALKIRTDHLRKALALVTLSDVSQNLRSSESWPLLSPALVDLTVWLARQMWNKGLHRQWVFLAENHVCSSSLLAYSLIGRGQPVQRFFLNPCFVQPSSLLNLIFSATCSLQLRNPPQAFPFPSALCSHHSLPWHCSHHSQCHGLHLLNFSSH